MTGTPLEPIRPAEPAAAADDREWTLDPASVPELGSLVTRVVQAVSAQVIQASAAVTQPGRFALGADADPEVVALHTTLSAMKPEALSKINLSGFLAGDRASALGPFATVDFTRPLTPQISQIELANPVKISADTLSAVRAAAGLTASPATAPGSDSSQQDEARDGATSTAAPVPFIETQGTSSTGSVVAYCVDTLQCNEVSGPFHHDPDHMNVIGSSVNTALIEEASIASSVAAATETISLDCGSFHSGDTWNKPDTAVASWVWPDQATFPMIIHTSYTIVHNQSDDANALATQITEAVKSKVVTEIGAIAGGVLGGPVGAVVGAAVAWAVGQVLGQLASWLESWFGGSGDVVYPAPPVHTLTLNPLSLGVFDFPEHSWHWSGEDNGADYQLSRHYRVHTKYQTQADWRWCSKCQALVFGGNAAHGVCPADHTPHNLDGSNYILTYDMPHTYYGAEADWHWCDKCYCLWRGPSTAVCAAGGQHSQTNSTNYSVVLASPASWQKAQGQWKLCGRCWVLAYSGNGQGSCAAGGGHNFGQVDHWLFYT